MSAKTIGKGPMLPEAVEQFVQDAEAGHVTARGMFMQILSTPFILLWLANYWLWSVKAGEAKHAQDKLSGDPV